MVVINFKKVGKGLKTQTIRNVFQWAENAGVERGDSLLGMPEETREDLKLTKIY